MSVGSVRLQEVDFECAAHTDALKQLISQYAAGPTAGSAFGAPLGEEILEVTPRAPIAFSRVRSGKKCAC
jgi:hypothetical protein